MPAGRRDPPGSRLPKTQNAPLRSGDLTSSVVVARLDLRTAAVRALAGHLPRVARPRRDGQVPTVRADVDRARLPENVPSRVGNGEVPVSLPQAPVDTVPMPVLSRPPTISPNVAATMSPPTKANRVRPQDQPDADADEDERPQAPEASDLVIRQVARSNGERDRPGEDQEDAPIQIAATHVHTDNGSQPWPAGNGRMSRFRPGWLC